MLTTILAFLLAVLAYILGFGKGREKEAKKHIPKPKPYEPPEVKDADDVMDAWDEIDSGLRGD